MKILKITAIMIFISVMFTACLTCEKKTYTFTLNGKGGGTLTIVYYNIMSSKDGDKVVTDDDFSEMMNDYINGKKMEEEFPNAYGVKKELYEEGGKLCGKVTLSFDNFKGGKLYQYDKKSPIMYSLSGSLSETYLDSNGKFDGDVMSVVFWPKGTKSLNLSTTVTKPDETTISLLDKYKA
ncbi:MAG: hypothetical protein V2A54_14555, partial [Bacteroidota bacterium]